ncbi:SIR2-like domain-containing protein [Xylaria nigripes]|nr:SIR2-like domain-containing protein [Xylaria nigripes]
MARKVKTPMGVLALTLYKISIQSILLKDIELTVVRSTTDTAHTLTQSSTRSAMPTTQRRREAKQRAKERKQKESLRIQGEAVRRLRDQLALGRLAICVGSGVTLYSAPSQFHRLSWWGLMANALDYFEDQAGRLSRETINKADLVAAREVLEKSSQTDADREDVTNRIQKLLSSRLDLESTWLRGQFKNLYRDYVDQHSILDALKALQEQGAMLLTTNYDDLLEKHCKLDALDASDPNGLVSYRRGSMEAIFHPHGYWRNPNHVVLSAEQYWRVKENQNIQETLQHILGTKTVLFVGCGGGLSDPNFGPLIQWAGEKNLGTGTSHYILLQRAEENPVTQLPLIHLRCESFDDISRFLIDLISPSERREGLVSEVSDKRERRKIHEWLAPVDQSGFLNDMLNLQGPSRFDQHVTMQEDVWKLSQTSRTRVKGKDGMGKTMFCASVIQNTLKTCRLGTHNRFRDSLAYFFGVTYSPYEKSTEQVDYSFSMFLRTVISHLCPPFYVFAPLRALYMECTRHHPARLPTNAELETVFFQILTELDKPTKPKRGVPKTQGKIYMVIDEVEALPTNIRSEYSRFIKTLAGKKTEHFHLLVTAEDSLSIGAAPADRPRRLNTGKKHGLMDLDGLTHALNTNPTTWHEIELGLGSIDTALLEYVRDRLRHDSVFEGFWNIQSWAVQEIHSKAQSLRWVYWQLDKLGQIGASANLKDDELKWAITEALNDNSIHEDEEGGSEHHDDSAATDASRSNKRLKTDD